MKQFILSVFFSVCLVGIVQAQDAPATLFGNLGNVKISGFGGPTVSVGVLDGTAAVFNGGGGAVMLNNFFFGGYGSNMSVPNVTRRIEGEDLRVKMQHGGLWAGYDIQAHKLVHFTTSFKLGWGSVRFYRPGTSFSDDAQSIRSERFMMMTPEVGVEVNITKFMKVALTGGYRVGVYSAITEDNGSNINLNGQYASLTFKFGWFGKKGPLKEIKDAIRN